MSTVGPAKSTLTWHGTSEPLTGMILLVDCDAFYVSVARLVDPEVAGRASCLIVGGSQDGRGVVTSASYEARKFGVRSAMPTGKALRLCPQATVVPVPRSACVQYSREVREVLTNYTPVVEPASIDEFYLDMTGTKHLYGGETLNTTAARIRRHVVEETGIPVSIGGGSSKLMAKLAAKHAKPSRSSTGVRIVPEGDEIRFMATLPLSDIPMIGPRFQEKLKTLGFSDVSQVLPLEEEQLTQVLGERTGRWLFARVRGRDSGIVMSRPPTKSLSHEETFARDLESDEDLNRELLRLGNRVGADLRRKGFKGRCLTVKLRDFDFKTRSASRTFGEPFNADRPIVEGARELLKKLRSDRRVPARLIGIAMTHIIEGDEDQEQLALFDGTTDELETALDRSISDTVDQITVRYGRLGIVRGAELNTRSR